MPTRLAIATLISCLALPLAAQGTAPVPHQLSLQQALQLARGNSPTYLSAQLNADPAAAAVRQAQWAQLPTISAGGGVSYTGAGSSTFGGTTFNQSSPAISSGYSLSASWQLSARTFLSPGIARASERATEESITATGVTLTHDVTTQYLNTLRAGEVVGVAVEQLVSDTVQLKLALAKQQVGQATLIDVLTAQTKLATDKGSWLQSKQATAQAKVELIRLLGLPVDANVDSITLSNPFPLVQPTWDLKTLVSMAHDANPTIRSLQQTVRANQLTTRAARSDRLPTFSISTGLNGFTQQFTDENILLNNALSSAQGQKANCTFQNQILAGLTTPIPGGIIPDCNSYSGLDATGTALLPSVTQQIHTSNSVFPFNFTSQPITVNFQISLPIWDAYSRSLRVSQAAAAEDQSRENVRGQRLLTDATIQSQLLAVQTAWDRTVIQDSNRVTAKEQLQLAQTRYQIGNGTALEVTQAQTAVTQAEADYVTAVYDYHLAVVGLEAAVGRPLR